jgi:hypothetical protein
MQSWPYMNAVQEYWLDAWQRSILFLDVMRERGNIYLEHSAKEVPHVLNFQAELVRDGRKLERPVNYALVRIVPLPGTKIDPEKPPIVAVDPRAGHGPGIGGMKHDSQIGVALAANRLELEITETALLQDNDTVLSTLYRLRKLGLRTVLDDFGTGYSSLSYLRSFPFDRLKIDQSFVREMATRPDCAAIVNSVASLALQLGITTTAEGVETLAQLDQVRRAGCTEAQGYYFDYPRPAAVLKYWHEVDTDELLTAA